MAMVTDRVLMIVAHHDVVDVVVGVRSSLSAISDARSGDDNCEDGSCGNGYMLISAICLDGFVGDHAGSDGVTVALRLFIRRLWVPSVVCT